MDELYEKFLPQFVELAKVRMERATETAGKPELASLQVVIREMHAIAGEAGLLGLASIMGLARQTEEHAKKLRDSGTPANADAFLGSIQDLKNALELVGASGRPPTGGAT